MGNAARNVSRASLNRVVSDFRMIEATGGVLAATSTSLTIRTPFAIGVMCGNAAGGTVISLLPVDSTTYAEATFYGYAWRNFTTGAYGYVESPATRATADAAQSAICVARQITTVPGGQIVYVTPVLPVGAGLGTPVFLYSRVRYEFKASVAVPGKLGLWRTEIGPGGALEAEELVAPFANTASWKFFTVNGRSVADQKSQISAFRIAEQGLEIFLVRRDSIMLGMPGYTKVPGAKDSVRIQMTGGYADVSLTRLRPVIGSQSGLYVVRSKGVETAGAYAGTPQGVRTVAQYVLWEPAPMQVLAGWTALSGIQKNGGAGTLGGIDLCGDSAAVAGVAVPVDPR